MSCLVDLAVMVSALRALDLGPVSWRATIVDRPSFSQSYSHRTMGIGQTEYQKALPSSVNVQSRLTSSFADDGNASWFRFVECRFWNDGWTVKNVVT